MKNSWEKGEIKLNRIENNTKNWEDIMYTELVIFEFENDLRCGH